MHSLRILKLEPALQKIRDSRELFTELAEEQQWPQYWRWRQHQLGLQGWAAEAVGDWHLFLTGLHLVLLPIPLLHRKKETRFPLQSLPFTPRATGNMLPSTSMTILLLRYHCYYNALMHRMEPQGRLYWPATCWETALPGSHISARHTAQALAAFAQDNLLRDVCRGTTFAEIMYPFKRQVWLLPTIKDSISWSSGVLSCNYMQVTLRPSSVTSREMGLRESAKYDDPLATATAVSNSPHLSPGVWCLPPASVKLWHLLPYKCYEISDPSQVPTLLCKTGTVLLIGAYEPKK